MNYIELTLEVADADASEIWTAHLSDWPFEGFVEEPGLLCAYMPEADYAGCRGEVEALLGDKGVRHGVRVIEPVNWNARWEASFEPIEVGGQCLIRAPFHAPREGVRYDLQIMPKMSFGTGHHATTRLMAGAMLESSLEGLRGLDMGSGTGVLAILAAKMGAAHVDAIDIDEWAWENCSENTAANGVADRVTPLLGDATLLPGRLYDFILANINRNILLRDMEVYVGSLRSGGSILLSGILEEDIPALRLRAAGLGLQLRGEALEGGWAALRFERA